MTSGGKDTDSGLRRRAPEKDTKRGSAAQSPHELWQLLRLRCALQMNLICAWDCDLRRAGGVQRGVQCCQLALLDAIPVRDCAVESFVGCGKHAVLWLRGCAVAAFDVGGESGE